ncbi:unnamed protein product [Aphanomyces euteiches]
MTRVFRVLVASRDTALPEKVRQALAALPASLGVAELELQSLDISQVTGSEPLNAASLDLLAEARILLSEPRVAPRLLPHAPKLEWLQSIYAGIEPLLAQPRRDFIVTRAGGIMGLHMAQYVLGWVISKERMFHLAPQYQAKKEFRNAELHYRHYDNVTVGILGLGDIGLEIGNLINRAGFQVVGLKRSGLTESRERFSVTSDLKTVLSTSDYVVNVLPSTPQTRNLLSGNVLQACQAKQPCFINVGRGDVVDEASLVHALDEKWLSSAVLDVFAVEPLPVESALWEHPQVTITPHVAALSMAEDVAAIFARNASHFLAKTEMEYKLEWDRGY